MNMWSKKNLFECQNSIIYIEGIGFGYLSGIKPENVSFQSNDQEYKADDLYRLLDDGSYQNLNYSIDQLLTFLFRENIYRNISFIDKQFEEVKIDSLSLQISIPVFSKFNDFNSEAKKWPKRLFNLTIKNRDELDNACVYYSDAKPRDCLKFCMLGLKENQKYHSLDYGIILVKKIYHELEENKPICEIELSDGSSLELNYGNNSLMILPDFFDDNYINDDLAFLDKSFNSRSLQCIVEVNNKTGDLLLMWKPITSAAHYSLEFYREIEVNNRKELYYLCNILVDNSPYYAIQKEEFLKFGHPLYVRLVATNEYNGAVAFSKGLKF